MSTTIRAAVLGDEELLAVLNGLVHELHIANRPDYFKPTAAEEVSAWSRSLLQKPTASIWIAEEGGVPVGYVLALLHERAENPFCPARRWCEIDQIAVDDKWRRRGLASLSAARVCTPGHPLRAHTATVKRAEWPRPEPSC
jgi:hypothetical protein